MKKLLFLVYFFAAGVFVPAVGQAMHIMEGFLPKEQALGWYVVMLPFILFGVKRINSLIKSNPESKMYLGLTAAFIFVLSALKIPSVIGSSSHATGVGLCAVLFGPAVSSVLSVVVLLFQALLLAHGGLSTLGANAFSMGIAGAIVAWSAFRISKLVGLSDRVAIFIAAALGDWATYLVTAGELALAFPDAVGGYGAAYLKFVGIFAITQIPLALAEGFLSVIVYTSLAKYGEQGLLGSWWSERSGVAK